MWRGLVCVLGNVLVCPVCMQAVHLHVCVQWMQSVLAGLDSEQCASGSHLKGLSKSNQITPSPPITELKATAELALHGIAVYGSKPNPTSIHFHLNKAVTYEYHYPPHDQNNYHHP